MLITDFLRNEPDITWEYAKQCGVRHAVIRLPEDPAFEMGNPAHWQALYRRYTDAGFQPVVVEPLPNRLHDHIKAGDGMRDMCIQQVIDMLAMMDRLDIRVLCFNFMAHIGWLRTSAAIPERGGALVTGFTAADFVPGKERISEQALWDNYFYFIRAVLPHAERHGIRLALHPDDPPLPALGDVSRILVSRENIERAIRTVASPNLGVTFCQANFCLMGEKLPELIPAMADRIFFVHFRNYTGTKTQFHETFHDNGDIDMAAAIALYQRYCPDVPVRVDHVPTMAGEENAAPGYNALGRLYALGYLRGLLEATK